MVPGGEGLVAGPRAEGRTLVAARHVVGHGAGGHELVENGELVWEDDRIVFVGRSFPGEVARRIDLGDRLPRASSISTRSPISTPASSPSTTARPG